MSSVAPSPILFERCEAHHLDEVMPIMTTAFSPDSGEAWTRSQCAGILPMAGVARLSIAVAPTAQRSGVGRALVDHFVAFAQGCGATRLHLEVREGNGAIGLYRAAGFKIAGRRRNYYRGANGQYDALTMLLASSES
jgi:ribosomal-protein-alanine N-acetyltransferase